MDEIRNEWFTQNVRASDVFEFLKDGKPWTRAQLAQATGLARSTVTARIDTLMKVGLVAPYGDAGSTGGRPPALIAMNPRARVVAGVDVGATHVIAVLSDLSGEMLQESRARIDVAEGPERVLAWVCHAVQEMLHAADRPVSDLAAVGMGLPGPVEYSTGRPINPPIMPGWDRYDVPGRVQQELPVPVLIDNDVNIMALGEQQTCLPAVTDLVFIKVGTGIGAGIISGGSLQRGAQGTAGDLGHVRVSRGGGARCRCGNIGCLEAIAAGPALALELTSAGETAHTASDVAELVRAGHLPAMQAVREAGRDIGEVVATLVNIINPAAVVVGGSLSEAGEPLLAGIREIVYERSLPLATHHLQVLTSAAGPQVGVRGAVAMAIGYALSPEAIELASAEHESVTATVG